MGKAALLSVTNKEGIDRFAKNLVEQGYTILSSSGTAKFLQDAGVKVTLVEDYTGQKEILDGRVKTLHPKIHAGLLAKRSNPQHMQQLAEDDIFEIDVVAVNLYPFIEKVQGPDGKDPLKMIEFIDIGGPAMIRAAAKNHPSIFAVIDPADYDQVIEALKSDQDSLAFRRKLASKVFAEIANYNLEIAKYFSAVDCESEATQRGLTPVFGEVLMHQQDLRYGENPHQSARLYASLSHTEKGWTQLSGRELSYNNLLDFDAAFRLITELGTRKSAAIFKHLNPCGVGRANSLVEALHFAKQGDPRSHFGGIIAFNDIVTEDVAEEIREGFVEIVLAPAYDEAGFALLKKRKNLRIIQIDLNASKPKFEYRAVQGGVLVQERDQGVQNVLEAKVVSKRKLTSDEMDALQFAWTVCSHVKSNAIVATNQEMIVSVGAGQMSRVDSAELLISRAKLHGNSLSGAVAASDAFFPFPDSVQNLINEGVSCIIAPGGAMKDQEVIDAVDSMGASLVFANERHFRH
ncbi:MAG: bifunctional phosphoribosylaminoimidazolecarboxamide formyltransferase/IMP cyclohydrolase [Deltaproteobacteria bacterium]|nr:bifunctional phosphoribosylaminoimidazolecarboxamide formyltransferase/IMP cyclohydrolase [Deltaproteobacteria bacterium]